MNIVIAGAGDVGFHLSQLLSNENNNITLIDTNTDTLNYASSHLDVLTVKGDCTSIKILSQVEPSKADLFIAVTTSEKTNILTAILAKKMGATKTIARVKNPEYISAKQKREFRNLGVDTIISPQNLAAEEIKRLIKRCSVTDIFEFERGKLSIIGFTLDNNSPFPGKSIIQIKEEAPELFFRFIAILRGDKTIIPSGNTILEASDHIYLVTRNKNIDNISAWAGKSLKKIKKIMIMGGSSLALRSAQLLEEQYSVSIVASEKNRCKELAEVLHHSLIIQGDPSNIDLLKEEGIEKMDAFIALTHNSEVNIITSLMAEQLGVYKTIALVDNAVYTHISQNIGVDTLINKKIIAANNISRFVRKGKVEAIGSLHGVNAEIIEYELFEESKMVGMAIKELGLVKNAIIVGIIRKNNGFVPEGQTILEGNDKIIVFAQPEAINSLDKIFDN